MRLYQRWFCYGVCVTSLFSVVLFYIYENIMNNSSVSENHVRHRLKSRHDFPLEPSLIRDINMTPKQLNDDDLYLTGNNTPNSDLFLSEISVIRNPKDQETRDEGMLCTWALCSKFGQSQQILL